MENDRPLAETRWGNTTRVCFVIPSRCAIDALLWIRDVGCERQGLRDFELLLSSGGAPARSAHYVRLMDEWVYPPIAEVFAANGSVPMETLVAARKRQLVDNIFARLIPQLCEGGGRLSGSNCRRFWWERIARRVEQQGSSDDAPGWPPPLLQVTHTHAVLPLGACTKGS